MTISKEKLEQLKKYLEVQGREGNYDYSEYMLGMYNGMEFFLSVIEDRDPNYKIVGTNDFIDKTELPIN